MGEIVLRRFGRPGDLGWVIMAHGELYDRELGWNTDFEALVARIVTDYATRHPAAADSAGSDGGAGATDSREAGWIAELDGQRVGCVFCMAAQDGTENGAEDTAQLRVLLVDPAARGLGLGSRLVDRCLEFAVQAGYRRMKLWTTDRQVTATAVYVSRGFTLVAEEPYQAYGDTMTSQVFQRDLTTR